MTMALMAGVWVASMAIAMATGDDGGRSTGGVAATSEKVNAKYVFREVAHVRRVRARVYACAGYHQYKLALTTLQLQMPHAGHIKS